MVATGTRCCQGAHRPGPLAPATGEMSRQCRPMTCCRRRVGNTRPIRREVSHISSRDRWTMADHNGSHSSVLITHTRQAGNAAAASRAGTRAGTTRHVVHGRPLTPVLFFCVRPVEYMHTTLQLRTTTC